MAYLKASRYTFLGVPHPRAVYSPKRRSPFVRIHAAAALFLSLLLCIRGDTAPSPNEELTAKTKLESLRKKVPDVLEEEVNKSDKWIRQYEASVQTMRMIGPGEAKLTVRLKAVNTTGVKDGSHDEVVVVYLSYYAGTWTTRRFESTWSDPDFVGGGGGGRGGAPRSTGNSRGVRFLMAALDEVAEKVE
jgi:hypothetical protein